MKRILFAIVSTVIVISGLSQPVDAQNARVLAQAERITGDKFTVTARTPGGRACMRSINRQRPFWRPSTKG